MNEHQFAAIISELSQISNYLRLIYENQNTMVGFQEEIRDRVFSATSG